MGYVNRVFRNAMMLEVVLECIGIFGDMPMLAEVAVVALATTAALWNVFLIGDGKRRGARG